MTFSFNPAEGYKGLVTNKKAVGVYARGGAYGPGTGAESYDLQSKTLGWRFRIYRRRDLTSIFVEPTLAAPAETEATITKAKEGAVSTARSWAITPAERTDLSA
ncbi:MAG: hypothetical protein JO334_11820 [Verrucomicrobia bacterium]|nr:hypothetical protein [Verrucomicrobiota bacterium]